MAIFDSLDSNEAVVLSHFLVSRTFRVGERLVRQGDPADGCFFLDEGTVRLEIAVDTLDGDSVLGFLDAGDVLGELSFFDDSPRSATAIAETVVVARALSLEGFARLSRDEPHVALRLLTVVGAQLSGRLRSMNQRLVTQLAADNVPAFLDESLERARVASESLRDWSETRIDGLIVAVCRAVGAASVGLAEQAVRSVGIGNAADKAFLVQYLAEHLPDSVDEQVCIGVIERDPDGRVRRSAFSVGVIAGLVPANSPIASMLSFAVAAIKARTGLVCAAHRRATSVVHETASLIRGALVDNGAPSDLIQCLQERTSRRTTLQLIGHAKTGVVIAAAGPEMARAALQSGKPTVAAAIGDAPVLVTADADVEHAARAIIASRSFDCGLLSGAEGHVFVVRSVFDSFAAALERSSAAVLSAGEVERVHAVLSRPDGQGLRGSAIGQSAHALAEQVGISRSGLVRLLVVPVSRDGVAPSLLADRSCPLVTVSIVDDVGDGISSIARRIQQIGGAVTVGIYTSTEANVDALARAVPACRVIVNTGTSLAGHGVNSDAPLSMILAGGSAQGCAFSGNVGAFELRNFRTVVRAR